MPDKVVNILLVEDEEPHALLIRRGVESRKDWANLTVTRSLREARMILKSFVPDLAIIDLGLRDGNGLELLQEVKGEALYPSVILTSHGDEDAAVAAMKAGALDYVVDRDDFGQYFPYCRESASRMGSHRRT